MREILADFNVYKNLRDTVQADFKLTANHGNWHGNVIKEIDAALETAGSTQGFSDLLDLISNSSQVESSPMNNFQNAFLLLDLIGFRPDKLSQKNGFGNLLNDYEHAFFASHCDIFVTNDKRLRAKAIALYEYYEIETFVFSVDQFVEHAHLFNYRPGLSVLFEDIIHAVKGVGNQQPISNTESVFYGGIELYAPFPIFNFYSHIWFKKMENSYRIRLIRDFRRFSPFTFYRELEFLVNSIGVGMNSVLSKEGVKEFVREGAGKVLEWKGPVFSGRLNNQNDDFDIEIMIPVSSQSIDS